MSDHPRNLWDEQPDYGLDLSAYFTNHPAPSKPVTLDGIQRAVQLFTKAATEPRPKLRVLAYHYFFDEAQAAVIDTRAASYVAALPVGKPLPWEDRVVICAPPRLQQIADGLRAEGYEVRDWPACDDPARRE